MGVLTALVTVLFVLVCAALVLVIIIQPGKGEGMGAMMGGMGAQIFGGGGAVTFLAKVTTGLAIAYMILVISLTKLLQPAAGPNLDNAKADVSAPAETTPTESSESAAPKTTPTTPSTTTGGTTSNTGSPSTTPAPGK